MLIAFSEQRNSILSASGEKINHTFLQRSVCLEKHGIDSGKPAIGVGKVNTSLLLVEPVYHVLVIEQPWALDCMISLSVYLVSWYFKTRPPYEWVDSFENIWRNETVVWWRIDISGLCLGLISRYRISAAISRIYETQILVLKKGLDLRLNDNLS